ncbi:MAG: 30S ribosomal protein S16 [Patescibacteria group bacterium]|nr:30S ribosomal protein S16 [Patescibacteria group bacterium]
MLAIKLKRIGKKHQAAFRVVVAEKKSKMAGRYVEDLGFWNPNNKKVSINKERSAYWIKAGAQPTDSVYNLMVKNQIIKGTKKPVHKKSKKPAETPISA